MLDIIALTRVDPETLRRNVWSRAVNGEQLASTVPLPKDVHELRAFRAAMMEEAAKNMFRANQPGEKAHEHVKALELPLGKMPTKDELRKAHRRLVIIHHPDRNPGDPEAQKRFERIQQAHEKLGQLHEKVEKVLSVQQSEIARHFDAHRATGGWKDIRYHDGRSVVQFPVEHLLVEQRAELADILKYKGYAVEEQFSDGHILSITKGKNPSATASEISQGLPQWAKEERKAATIISAVEKSAVKSGKTGWIIGGIIAATVAIGAVMALQKKDRAEQEKRNHNAQQPSHSI